MWYWHLRIAEVLRRLAAPPPEILREHDPNAVAWAWLGNALVTEKGKRHVEMVMDKIKKKELSKQQLDDLATAPLGRTSSDHKFMALWFGQEVAMLPPYRDSIMAAHDQGLISDDAMLAFQGNKNISFKEYVADAAQQQEPYFEPRTEFETKWYEAPETPEEPTWALPESRVASA